MPLTQWEDGTIRITGTRVTLDVIINQFKLGATAEQLHDNFPAASLQDTGEWRENPHTPCDAKATRGQGRPRESAACAS
jgi:hypothetical protein